MKPASKDWRKTTVRYFFLLSGFFILSTGLVIMIESGLGVPPWDVLHLGVYGRTRLLTLGQINQGTGFFLILASYFLGVRPHVATIMNMVFVGLFIDLIYYLDFIHISGGLPLQVTAFMAGAALMGFGTATYMTANLGAGPRDSLMVGLTRKTGINMGVMRSILEVSVTLVGISLGGPFGPGTLMFALSIGFFMQMGFRFYRWFKGTDLYLGLIRTFPEKGLDGSSPPL